MNNNEKAIQLLDEWFNEPDDMGEDFWDEYERELKQNPLALSA